MHIFCGPLVVSIFRDFTFAKILNFKSGSYYISSVSKWVGNFIIPLLVFNITFFVCVGFQWRIPPYLILGLFTYCTAIQGTPADLSTLNHYLFSVIKFSTASRDHSKQTSCKFFGKLIYAAAECNFYDSRSYAVSIPRIFAAALREYLCMICSLSTLNRD